MPKSEKSKKVKVKTQIRIMRPDLLDLIRDTIYGAGLKEAGELSIGGKNVICIPVEDVKEIAKRIAKRAIIGH
jgi:hypothetical protein